MKGWLVTGDRVLVPECEGKVTVFRIDTLGPGYGGALRVRLDPNPSGAVLEVSIARVFTRFDQALEFAVAEISDRVRRAALAQRDAHEELVEFAKKVSVTLAAHEDLKR